MSKKIKSIIKFLMPVFFLFLFLVGCGAFQDSSEEVEDERIQVVTTTTMITDLVKVIGGNQVHVNGLMGPGIDPHGYRATASDVTDMGEADVVVYNGMHLEGQMGEVFSELENIDKDIFVLEEVIAEESMLGSEDESMPVDPHIWFSVPLWADAADYIAHSFSEYDPENADYYQENNEKYHQELEELDAYIRNRVEEVPEDSRYLVTAHDAFGYFGDEYGFEVIGLQGLNTQTEAGTRDVSNLANFIVENEIKAIFIESSVPTRTIESLQEAVQQREWNVQVGGELYSDSLGDAEQNAETYIKMYQHNIDTIVDALK